MKRFSILITIILPFFGLISLLSLFTPQVHALDVSGPINTDTTWTLANSPYIMKDNVGIETGVTLTIEAGVEVIAENDAFMGVSGHLNVMGTPTATTVISNLTSIQIAGSGSASIENAQIIVNGTHPLIRYGIGIYGNSNNTISITNSTIENAVYPILTDADSIHRLRMDDVTFTNNINNKVFISVFGSNNRLRESITLKSQPTLEAYEIIDGNYLTIPDGVTLTVDAGVTLLTQGDEYLIVEGNIVANGTETNTVTFSGFPAIEVRGTGATNINHAHIYVHDTHPHIRYGLGISGDSNNLVEIKNSTIENAVYPILTDVDSIHRLQMDDVTFINNINNKVFISTFNTNDLSKNITLTSQHGLEAYEIIDGTRFAIPDGITLTLEANTTLMSNNGIHFEIGGHLQSKGSIADTNIITGFTFLDFIDTGSADIDRTHIYVHDTDPTVGYGIFIIEDSNNTVSVSNSFIENAKYPVLTEADGIHRLRMDNVTFANNVQDRVFIFTPGGSDTLTANVALSPQPNLEGYEIVGGNPLKVPDGITLTLDAGSTLITDNEAYIEIGGHLESNGSITSSTAITGFAYLDFMDTGSGNINHTQIFVNETNPIVRYGIFIIENSNAIVSISNSAIQNAIHPVLTEADSIHRLRMDNVTFTNNVNDRVFIFTPAGSESLASDVILSLQPGLEGYEFPGDKSLQIPEGVTMSVEPGVSLLISESGKLEVYGRLEAKGAPLNPVTFTSAEDSATGQWQGITVHGGEVNLQNAEIRYGISNLSLISPTSQVTISHTNIISASQYGILVQDGQLTMQCSSLLNNEDVGIAIEDDGIPNVSIQQSEFSGNSHAAITNTHATLGVDAQFNWWGAANGPSGDFAGSGDAVFGQVDVSPWLVNLPDCSQQISQIFLPMMIKP